MRQSLYPKERYPSGHPLLVKSLNNIGSVLQAQGSYREAEPYFQRALGMCQVLYPKARYPQGHVQLHESLSNLASLYELEGEYGRASRYTSRLWRVGGS